MKLTGTASLTDDATGNVTTQPVVVNLIEDEPPPVVRPGGQESLRSAWYMQTNGDTSVEKFLSMEKSWFKREAPQWLAGTTTNFGRGRRANGSPGGTVPYTEAKAAAAREMRTWQIPEIAKRGNKFTLAATMSILCNPPDNDQTPSLAYRKAEMAKLLNGDYDQVWEDIAATLAHKSAGGSRTFQMMIRLAHEMDGLFYVHSKWAHTEEEFAAAMNRVIGIMRKIDATLLFDYGSNGPSFIQTVESMQRRFVESGAGNIPINNGDDRWCHEYGFPGSKPNGKANGVDTGGLDMYVGGGMSEALYFRRANRALEWCKQHKLPFTAYEIGASIPEMSDTRVRQWLKTLLWGGEYADASGLVKFPGLASLPDNMLEAVSYFIMQGDYSFHTGDAPLTFNYVKGGPQVSATSSGLGGML